jgi:hypothetical protein
MCIITVAGMKAGKSLLQLKHGLSLQACPVIQGTVISIATSTEPLLGVGITAHDTAARI